jgi:hypothetical protein
METPKCKIRYIHDFDNLPCKMCRPEYHKDYYERRARFIGKALSINRGGADEDEVIKEAGEVFDKRNA